MRALLIAILVLLSGALSAQVKVSALPPSADPDDDDILIIVEDGTTSKVTKELLFDDLSDSIINNSDSIGTHRTDIDAKIGLDETKRLTVIPSETPIEPYDSIVMKIDGSEYKLTKGALYEEAYDSLYIHKQEIAALEDSITNLRTVISALQLESVFDSLVISADLDTVYAYYTAPTGQLKIPWSVGAAQDVVAPTFVSGEVGNVADDKIVITMSEHILGDSIIEWSGGAGGTWTGLDHAYNFDQTSGDLLDQVGSDHGTNYGAYTTDSTGIASFGWYYDGSNDYTTITGTDHGSTNFAYSMWFKPHTTGTDESLLGYTAASGGMQLQLHNSGSVRLGVGGGSYTSLTTATVNQNAWNHLAFYYDQGNNKVRYWLNGVDELMSFSSTFTNPTNVIGALDNGYEHFEGMLDDIFIWASDTITDARADSLYNSGAGRRYNGAGGSLVGNVDTIQEAFTIIATPLGSSFTVDSVWALGNKITLDLDADVLYSNVISVNYTKPTGSGSNRGIRDTASNYAATHSLLSITNNIDTSTFITYNEWDFSGESLGHWTDAEIDTYWPNRVTGGDNYHNTTYETWHIVSDTIDGVASNALRWTHNPSYTDESMEIMIDLTDYYEELYLTYNFKLGKDFAGNRDGGKMSGLSVAEVVPSARTSSSGFLASAYFDRGASLHPYIYDHIYDGPDNGSHPRIGDHQDTILLTPGTWYNITERVVINSFTGSEGNYDGIYEVFIDGRIFYQFNNIRWIESNDADLRIGSVHLMSFYNNSSKPRAYSLNYHYIDNINVYIPPNDATYGARTLHTSNITTPEDIASEEFYYDTKITSDATDLETYNYPSASAFCINEQWLIDAGAGNQVRVDFDAGEVNPGDYLVFYDGNTTDTPIKYLVGGQEVGDADDNLGNNFSGSDGIIESSDRYLYVVFITDDWYTGGFFTANITFF